MRNQFRTSSMVHQVRFVIERAPMNKTIGIYSTIPEIDKLHIIKIDTIQIRLVCSSCNGTMLQLFKLLLFGINNPIACACRRKCYVLAVKRFRFKHSLTTDESYAPGLNFWGFAVYCLGLQCSKSMHMHRLH